MYLWINGELGLVLYISNKIRNFKFNKFEIFILIMILISSLSLITSIDFYTAIVGKSARYEGLLFWLTYYIFMLNAMNILPEVSLVSITSKVSITLTITR